MFTLDFGSSLPPPNWNVHPVSVVAYPISLPGKVSHWNQFGFRRRGLNLPCGTRRFSHESPAFKSIED
jgi:hypothetical protein